MESKDEGLHFIETAASRDALGRAWTKDADCVYDADDEDNMMPPTRFIVWDDVEPDIDDAVLDRPSSVVDSVSVFASEHEDSSRPLLRTYTLCKINPSVETFKKVTSEGDLEMVRQLTEESKRMQDED